MTNCERLLYAGAIIFIFFAGWFGRALLKPSLVTDSTMKRLDSSYNFINPLLSCSIAENSSYAGYASLHTAYQKIIAEKQQKGDIQEASIYFRDMNSGRWIGYNENAKYWPASLMKVPTLMALLRKIHESPALAGTKIKVLVPEDQNAHEYFKPVESAKNGATYTIQELITLMMRYSDNNATLALSQIIGTDLIQDVFEDGEITLPQNAQTITDYLSPRSYSYFFRLLYNATYLGRAESEFALAQLADTDFTKGIVAGVPAGVRVAHKFGEEMPPSNDTSRLAELHDCGIVYHEKNPYLLCVMTRGKNIETLSNVIKEISEVTYREIESTLKQ